MADAVEQYLARYAEAEARLADGLEESYSHVLVVPARGESSALLEGYRLAARQVERLLLIVVVNGLAADAETQRLARQLVSLGPARSLSLDAALVRDPNFDLLVLDRAASFGPKQGVGLARRMGMDLALAAWRRGRVRVPWFFTTDADARLPADHFLRVPGAPSSACVYPFRHDTPAGALGAAHASYELYLRYTLLGMSWAGSPYAYHAIGSCLSVAARAYAQVRGFPKRQAGEDFYVLDKLAKLAPVHRLTGEPVALAARSSARVPFGTGPAVARLMASPSSLRLRDPRVFAALRAVLARLDALSETRAVAGALAELDPVSQRFLRQRDGERQLAALAEQAPTAADLRARVHTWFDALATLRLTHALRDGGLPDRTRGEALASAEFCSGIDPHAPITQQLAQLAAREPHGPIGPTLPVSL